ncbi:BPK_collapsed_G0007930.mRNA.1.CDS.1 [Saccharomyces cerevisiae]|nr:BPK_collapsed_G0007930.mRNA.1.CDS.1 [Saccharomyces cerevisiae]
MGEGTTKENNNAEFNAYHTLTAEEAAEFIGTSLTEGLTQDEFVHRLKTVGENTLGDDTKIDYKAMVLHQVCNAMIMVLLISMIISFAMHDWITGGVISFVVGVNVGIGLVQEYKATKTMNSLKNLSSPNAHVIRNGKSETINSKDVVPGDICLVKVGDTIPADLRLIETKNFDTDESLLTGESLPVSKDANLVFGKEEETSVGDRLNLAFSSSTVVKGRAKGIVIKTALNSEIGKIAKSLQGDSGLISRDPSKSWLQNTWISTKKVTGAFLGTNVGTPLHRKLSKLAVLLFWIAVLFAIIVMASQKFDVDKRVAIYAICVALSMIPSSLVVVLTITMSVGAAVMVSRNVIVRKLDSLEALGAVNDICSDKTGTLTQGKMLARQIWIPRFGTITISNSDDPFNPNEGNVSLIPRFSPYEYSHNEDGDVSILQNFKDRLYEKDLPEDIDMDLFQKWLETATLANIATVFKDDATDCWKAHGDPTEIAIQVFATKMDLPRNALTGEKSTNQSNENDQSSLSQHNEKPGSAQFEHIAEFPFDSTVKRMSSVYYNNHNETYNIYGKGAFESIISCCSSWYGKDGVKITPLTDCDVETIRKNVYSLSNEGLRVLGFASKSFTKDQVNDDQLKNITSNRATAESDLVFLGLIGIYDPPRNETAGAVKKFHQAGINVHMLTGDFVGTAKAIAQEVGILPTNLYHYSQEIVDSMVMTGSQFDGLSEEEVDDLPVLPFSYCTLLSAD